MEAFQILIHWLFLYGSYILFFNNASFNKVNKIAERTRLESMTYPTTRTVLAYLTTHTP